MNESNASPDTPSCAVVFVMCLTLFASNFTFSVISSFVPQEAENYGVSTLGQGVINAAQKLGTIASVPAIDRLCSTFGNVHVLVAFSILHALAVLSNGFLAKSIHDPIEFTSYFVCARFVQGLANAQAEGAAMGMMIRTVPLEKLPQAVALSEAVRGVGLSAGPLIGAALYDVSGSSMTLPFVVCGLFLVIPPLGLLVAMACSPPLRQAMSIAGATNRPLGAACELMRMPAVFLLSMWTWLIIAPLGWWESTVANAWRRPPLSMSTIEIGIYLAVGGLCTVLSALALSCCKMACARVPTLCKLALPCVVMGAGHVFVALTAASRVAQIGGWLVASIGFGIGVVVGPLALTRSASISYDGHASSEQLKKQRAEGISTVLVLNFPVGLILGSVGYSAISNATNFTQTAGIVGAVDFGLLLPLGLLYAMYGCSVDEPYGDGTSDDGQTGTSANAKYAEADRE